MKNPDTKGFIILGRRFVQLLCRGAEITHICRVALTSDGVLNPSGVRFGSAEIYTVLENFREELDDSLCIGQRRPEDKDERVLLFIKMRPGYKFSDALVNRIKKDIRKALSPRHVPAYVFEIEDIPVSLRDSSSSLKIALTSYSTQYTVNNKKIEIAVKQIVSGSHLKPSGTVANPESLQLYYKFRHLESLLGTVKAKL